MDGSVPRHRVHVPPVSSREMPAVSTQHRKPVLAFVVLALAAVLVIGAQQADARGGRLLAGTTGAGVHVQGTLSTPEPTLDARESQRLADLAPAFVSVREKAGHAGTRTVAAEAQREAREARPAGTRTVAASGTQSTRARTARAGAATRSAPVSGRPAVTPGRSATSSKAGPRTAGRSGPTHPKSRAHRPAWAGQRGGPGRSAAPQRPSRPATSRGRAAAAPRATGVRPSTRGHRGGRGRH